MDVRFKKFSPDAIIPEFQTDGSLASDLAATEEVTIYPGKASLVPLGIGLDIPEGHMVMLCGRSSLGIKRGLFIPHGFGLIDSDYKGEIKMVLATIGNEPITVEKGERIAQIVLVPCRGVFTPKDAISKFIEVEDLGSSYRDEGSFGSTGRF